MIPFYQIHPIDQVATALQPLIPGVTYQTPQGTIVARSSIPAGHKIALVPLIARQTVYKYGMPIGQTTQAILPGEWVHCHNLISALRPQIQYAYTPRIPFLPRRPAPFFQGYIRQNGSVGTRNDIWIIPTVGCVNALARELALSCTPTPPIDSILALTHPYGCSQLGDDLENTLAALAGLIRHPNAGGILLISLGCESAAVEQIRQCCGEDNWRTANIRVLRCQDEGDEREKGRQLLFQLMEQAGRCTRQAVSLSRLIVGVNCGGSDGFSGLTSNPLIGLFCQRHISWGGSVVLTEVPEMFGAETILLERCISQRVFHQTVQLIHDFQTYFLEHHQPITDNPSPGNLAGGITTLEEKSLGCIQKCGLVPVCDVLNYGEQRKSAGLSLLYSPGNDLVSSTAQVISGAQLILFSTGRGTPFGAPVPTLKISSNSALAQRKPHWIDFDAGVFLQNLSDRASVCHQLAELVRDTASGRPTCQEQRGFTDLAIFKSGVTL